jgi:hypothetical protein
MDEPRWKQLLRYPRVRCDHDHLARDKTDKHLTRFYCVRCYRMFSATWHHDPPYKQRITLILSEEEK